MTKKKKKQRMYKGEPYTQKKPAIERQDRSGSRRDALELASHRAKKSGLKAPTMDVHGRINYEDPIKKKEEVKKEEVVEEKKPTPRKEFPKSHLMENAYVDEYGKPMGALVSEQDVKEYQESIGPAFLKTAALGIGASPKAAIGMKAGADVGQMATKALEAGDKISKAQKVLNEAKAVNRLKAVFKISEKQAQQVFKASGKIPAQNLLEKARGLGGGKGIVGFGKSAFWATLGIQVMQFWGGVDNVAGLASLDAYKLMDEVKWSTISRGETESEIERINSQLEFARQAVNSAAWINPLTGWAIGKFYKGVIARTQESLDFKTRSIYRSLDERELQEQEIEQEQEEDIYSKPKTFEEGAK